MKWLNSIPTIDEVVDFIECRVDGHEIMPDFTLSNINKNKDKWQHAKEQAVLIVEKETRLAEGGK